MFFDGFSEIIFWTCGIIFAILVWFIPIICAKGNENENKIFWLTLCLGYIPPIWVVLLLAALLGKKK